MKKILFAATFLLLFLAAARAGETPAAANAGEKIVCLLTPGDYAPYCFAKNPSAPAGKKGEPEKILPGRDAANLQGYAWEIVRSSFQAQGFTLMLRELSWREAASRARSVVNNAEKVGGTAVRPGDYTVNLSWNLDTWFLMHQKSYGLTDTQALAALFFPVVRSAERDQKYQYSAEPLFTSAIVIYVKAQSPLTEFNPQALAGKNVGFIKEYSCGDLRARCTGAKIMEIDNLDSAFSILRSGRIEALVGYEGAMDFLLRKNKIGKLFRKIPTGVVLPEYLCGLRNDPRTSLLLEAFAAGRRKIAANGVEEQIAEKWGVTPVAGKTVKP